MANTIETTPDGGRTVAVTVTTDGVAVGVALTSGAPGYFVPVRAWTISTAVSRQYIANDFENNQCLCLLPQNYFFAVPGTTSVKFVLFATANAHHALELVRNSTRIEHMAQHVHTARFKTDGTTEIASRTSAMTWMG